MNYPLKTFAVSFITIILNTVSFAQAQFIDSGQALGKDGYGCAIGDLNNDGYLDIYVAHADLGPDQIWLNNGKGVFTNSGQNIGNAVKRNRSIALADLNGDGFLDVFIANDQIGNPIGCPNEVWINDGTGKFSDSGQRLGNLASVEVALVDIDGDGDKDAVIANLHDQQGNNQPNEIWLNDGQATFTNSGINMGERSYSVILADVNNDGNMDVIFDCIIWINNGNLNFTKSTQTFGNGRRLYYGDFDGDGDQDAFVLRGGPNGDTPNEIWSNDGAGKFTDSGQRLGNSCGYTAAIADFDGDGDLDIYVANGFFNKIEPDVLWINQGGKQNGALGTFKESGIVFSPSRSWEVKTGDLDNDGDLDVFVTNGWGRHGDNKIYFNFTDTSSTGKDRVSAKAPSVFPTLKGPYLGQQPPGLKAEPFAPTVLSVPGKNHHTLSFSIDGKELYFSRYPERVTLVMRQVDGIWQPPMSTTVVGWEAIFTPDGQSLIFGNGDLWGMHRTTSGWSQPEKLKGGVNSSSHDYYASVANDGTLYFSRIVNERARILRAHPSGDGYDSVKESEATVNGVEAYHPFVAPDGSYLLFNSRNRTGGYGGADIYVSFRQPSGSFGKPVNLGPGVNSADFDLCPVVTPDGKYLFFTRIGKDSDGNMTGTPYWVSTRVIEEARTRAKQER
jgi:hypothetical protein